MKGGTKISSLWGRDRGLPIFTDTELSYIEKKLPFVTVWCKVIVFFNVYLLASKKQLHIPSRYISTFHFFFFFIRNW